MKKLVVITGASSGIGKATAIKFAKEGYPLLILARRVELLEELNLPNTICKKVDVTNFEEFQNAVKEAEAKFGPVDLLLNNAGIMKIDNFAEQNREDKFNMIDINLKGLINGVDTVLNGMIKKQCGTIINVGSVAGRWTSDFRAVYNGTKFGVHAFSEQLRKEVGKDNVRVLTLAPAIVDTPLVAEDTNEDVMNAYQNVKTSIDKGVTSEETADIIFWMYSMPQHLAIKEVVFSHTKQKI